MEDDLVTLVLLHAVEIGIEEVGGVERTAFGFRMELRAEDRPGLVDYPY